MFRKLSKWLNPSIDLKVYRLRIKKKRKLPEDILSPEEVLRLLECADSLRYRAIISTIYESGCRVGELLGIRVKDLFFDDYGAVIMVDGKTGMRRIRLVSSVPLLAQYLQDHRFRDDSLAPLFYRIDKRCKTVLSETAVNKMLKDTALRAGIKKRVYPHLFRHSRATHLAKYLTEQELKVFFGWAGDSKMACVYVHLSGRDIEAKILEINGLRSREQPTESLFRPKECPRCRQTNSPEAKYCNQCGATLGTLLV